MSRPSPGNSHAVVVGIEEYKAGPSWNLDGPASDALRMLEYVRGCGVPQANTRALLAPLAQNGTVRQQAEALAASVTQPTQAALDDLIEQWLPALKSDLLYSSLPATASSQSTTTGEVDVPLSFAHRDWATL